MAAYLHVNAQEGGLPSLICDCKESVWNEITSAEGDYERETAAVISSLLHAPQAYPLHMAIVVTRCLGWRRLGRS